MKRRTAAALALTLAAATATIQTSHATTTAPAASTATTATGPLVATGTLAGTGTVRVEIAPTSDTLHRLTIGESARSSLLATGPVTNGTYTAYLTNPAALTNAPTNRHGKVDYRITAMTDTGVYTRFGTTTATRIAAMRTAAATTTSSSSSSDATTSGTTMPQLPAGTLTREGAPAPTAAAKSLSAADAQEQFASTTCTSTKVSEAGTRGARIGQTYNQTTGVTGSLSFGYGADISSTTAWSFYNGSFTESSSVSLGSNMSIDMRPSGNYHRQIHVTKVHYAKFREWCGSIIGPKYRVRPTYIAGGNYSWTTSHKFNSRRYCVRQVAGDRFAKTTTNAQTNTDSVDLLKHAGIKLDTRSGYTTDVTQRFTFRGTRRLCGTRDTPGGTPRVLYAVSRW